MTGEEKRETRIIRCPACRQYYRMAAGPPAPGTRLRCSKCGAVFSSTAEVSMGRREGMDPSPAPGAAAAAPDPVPSGAAFAVPGLVPPAPDRGRVLVSTDGADLQSLIGEVLAAAGFSLRQALSGDEAWAVIGSWRPHVALLDVALPGVPAFELCDRVRADRGLRDIGLILIASVFQQTRYKRAPTSLYGADDYIEKHHICDRLSGQVARLLPGVAVPAALTAASPAAAASSSSAGVAGKRHGTGDKREQETLIREELQGFRGRERLEEGLRRYARIIISDIALYNQELVERGIREGTFCELLKKEIEEGHRLYLARVPAATGGADYYHEVVRDFIARRTGARGDGVSRPRGKA